MMLRQLAVLFCIQLFIGGIGCNDELRVVQAVEQPAFPECEATIGDDGADRFALDLSAAESPEIYYLVANQSRNRGITINGYEIYTTIPGQGIIYGKENFSLSRYLDEETRELVFAHVISPNVVETLQDAFNCDFVTQTQVDAIGQSIMTGDTILPPSTGSGSVPTQLVSTIFFKGKTDSGKEVYSGEFDVTIDLYCGPDGGWDPCFANPCNSLCGNETVSDSCFEGMYSQPTCDQVLSKEDWFDPVDGEEYCAANCAGLRG